MELHLDQANQYTLSLISITQQSVPETYKRQLLKADI